MCVCVCVCMYVCMCMYYELSCFIRVQLCATLWTVAHQAPLSMGFSRQEYWSGLLFPPSWDLPNPGMEPVSPAYPVCIHLHLHLYLFDLNREIYCLRFVDARSLRARLARLISSESSLLGLLMAVFFLCLHVVCLMCVFASLSPLLTRTSVVLDDSPP